MNAHPKFLNLAGIAAVVIAGSVAAAACSSNNAGPSTNVLDSGSDDSTTSSGSSGSSGSSSGSSSSSGSGSGSGSSSGDSGGDAKPDTGPACTSDGGAGATCNSCAHIRPNDVVDAYNTCSAYNCAGFYNNSTHGVPSSLPPL